MVTVFVAGDDGIRRQHAGDCVEGDTVLMTPKEAIVAGLKRAIPHDTFETLASLVLLELRANGYVIKRAVPPCRGYDFEEEE